MNSDNNSTSPRVVCLIAVLGRADLVRANVHLLKHQTTPVDILLLVSTDEDQQVAVSCQQKYSSSQPNRVHFLRVPNRPLGRKWQLGLEHARDQFEPDAVLINGSDDLLSPNYAEKAYSYLINKSASVALVGKKDWYIYDSQLESGYRIVKNIYSVLGAGRMFSGRFLADQLDWKLFPVNKNSQLDAGSYNRMSQAGGKQAPIKDNSMIILSLKGKHKVLSSTSRIVGRLPPLTDSDPRLELLEQIELAVREQNFPSLLESMQKLEKLNLP